jgi:hypothetical protein
MWLTVLEVLGGVAVALLLGLVLLALRRRLVQRGGSFDCSMRMRNKRFGQGWALGVARYTGNQIEWYRVFSMSVRPSRVLPRDRLKIIRRRQPEYPETLAIMNGHVILECTEGGVEISLAMSDEATTGFAAWLEAGPPGRNVGVV